MSRITPKFEKANGRIDTMAAAQYQGDLSAYAKIVMDIMTRVEQHIETPESAYELIRGIAISRGLYQDNRPTGKSYSVSRPR